MLRMKPVGENKQFAYYRLSTDEVISKLHSNPDGLSEGTARNRYEQTGPNVLVRSARTPLVILWLRQFKDLLVIMLLISAGLSVFLRDFRTAAIMGTIACINICIGFFQERKAENLLESLEKLVVQRAKVIRDGAIIEIESKELVPGDIMLVEAGDNVPADGRVLQEDELATNDFALTGESQPSRKFKHAISADVPIGNRHNIIYMGTTVALGNGRAIVTGTGMYTELGRIASLSQSAPTDTSPLQREMKDLAVKLSKATLVLAGVLLIIQLGFDMDFKVAVLFAISIAAAMIPNGLVAELNINLAQTAARMTKARALVKKLSAVETLGATDIILTDKTGTLTKNEMTVEELLVGRTEYKVLGTGYEANGDITDSNGMALPDKTLQELHLVFETAALASNAQVNPPDNEHMTWHVIGDPTEGALITLARKAGLNLAALNTEYPETKEYAFDSGRKCMSSVRKYNGKNYLFVKGAPENILEHSTKLWDHTFTRDLTNNDRKRLLAYNEDHAAAAQRNLALAYRILPDDFDAHRKQHDEAEQDLIFIGIVSMIDPLREEVLPAMLAAHGAHIKVSVITGDFPITGAAITRRAGLGNGAVTVVMSDELQKLSDGQILDLVLQGGAVFSRVNPEDKLRIVEIAKRAGHVVAVTGDGINDAPALKRADIGVAMGRTGTDVAKDAAEIVLLDDSFGTLVTAIKHGRLTFQNITKAAHAALTDNAGELFVILISLAVQAIWHIPAAITAIQILAIDLIAELFPVTALGWDPPLKRLMRNKPRNLHHHIINRTTVMEFIGYGLLAAVLAYANYLFFFFRHDISPVRMDSGVEPYLQATILTYVTLVLCQFVNLLIVRTLDETALFSKYLWSNRKLLISFAVSFIIILNIVYNPLLQPFFGAAELSLWDWATAFFAAGLYTLIRIFLSYNHRHSRAVLFAHHSHEAIRKHLIKYA